MAPDGSRAVAATGPQGSLYIWTASTQPPTRAPTRAPTTSGGVLAGVPGTSPFNWSSLASDATGTRLLATVDGGGLHQSLDGGASWAQLTGPSVPPANSWTASASSGNGSVLVAVADGRGGAANASVSSGVWVSLDGGQSWTEQPEGGTGGLPSPANWTGAAVSADGLRITVTDASGKIWTSTSTGGGGGGISWSDATSPSGTGWSAVATARNNGSVMIAAQDGGSLFISTSGGASWQQQQGGQQGQPPSPGAWVAVAASGNGAALYAAEAGGSLWKYDVATAAWTELAAAGQQQAWTSISVSDDGRTVLAGVAQGPLAISRDGGACVRWRAW